MDFENRRIAFIEDVVENGKQGVWNDYVIKYDLKDTKQASDFYRYYQRTGRITPDYNRELEDNIPDYYAGIPADHVPAGAKIRKAWGKPGSMMLSLDFSDKEAEDKADRVIETLKGYSPKVIKLKPKETSGMAAMLSIPDLHYGKGPLEETSLVFKTAVTQLLGRIDLDKVEKFIVPLGNDILNSEGNSRATTKGTPQWDSAEPWDVFDRALQDCIDVLTHLAKIAPVEVFFVHGNHDKMTSMYLGRAIQGFMHNNENVTIVNSAESRSYTQYGVTGFMFDHGELKTAEYPIIFASEQPKLWGNTVYRESILGHMHHQDTKEFRGYICRYLPSLGRSDKWHRDMAYSATRAAQLYKYDTEAGFMGMEEFRI